MYFKELKNENKSVIRIAHSADIHIRNSSRHKEYKRVFKKWYNDLKIQKPDLIVLAGDIIHSKTTISPEVPEIVYSLFNNLSKIADVIIIPGNHDINLSNLERKNILSVINRLNKIKNVFLLEKSGIYRYNNIDFYHYSLLDNNHPKEIKDNNQTNIALWHGTVDTSTNKYNHEFHSKINYNTFNQYDYTFLGDIHKRQLINNDKTIQYPGSLITQDFGEDSIKGYLLWNLENKDADFITIENLNTFYTIYIRKNKILNIDDIKVKNPRIRIFIDDISLKSKNKFINEIKKRCNPIEISILNEIVDYKTNVSSKLRFNNFYDINVQNKLLISFLKQRYENISNEEIDKVLSINKEIEEQLLNEGQYNLPNYNTVWNIEEIKFSNFFKYGENNKINFNNINEVTGIFGRNNAGKSSLFEIIFFALYGRTQKKINIIDIVNDKKLHCKVKVNLLINNVSYIIERKIQLKNSKKHGRVVSENTLDFYKINDEDKILLNGDDKNRTERNIRKLLGNPEDFLNTSMIPQNRSTKFIQSINYRKKFISQMIGLEAIQKKFEKAKHIFRKKNILLEDLIEKNFKDKFAVVINNISGFTEKIKRLTNIKNEVTDNIKQLKKDIKNKQKKIKNFDEEIVNIEDLEKNKSKLNENINNNKDKLINLNNNINENKKLLEQLKNKIQKFDYSLFENIENRFDKARKEYNYTNREIEKTKYIITDILKKIKILDEQPWCLTEEICKKCVLLKSTFENKDKLFNELYPKTEKLLIEKNKKEKTYNKLETLIENFKVYKEIKLKIDSINNTINLQQLKLNNTNREIKDLENQLNEINKKIILYNKNKTKIENNKQLEQKIKKLELLLKSNEKRLNNIEEEITNCKIEKRTNELKKDEIIIELDRIEKLDEESCYYKYYIEAMDKDNIPSQIIKDFLPEINKKITNILERTVPFSIQVEYNENDDLSIILIGNDGSRKPIESEGGMANVIAGLSLRVALIELSSLPKSSLFAIDEQFSALDNEILSSISNLFDYIKRKFKNVLLITHLTSIKDDVNSVIEIYNDGKFSYVNV